MTSRERVSLFSRVALAVSAVAALGAIVYSVQRGEGKPAMPTAAASPAAPPATTAADLAEAARARPNDAQAWLALGRKQADGNDYAGAEASYRRVVALAPNRAEGWSALGEAIALGSAHDPMPAAALDAFKRAHAIDAKDPRARYFLAVARDLKGDHKGAIDDWFALLDDTPPGAPWEADLRRTIDQVGRINKIDVAPRLAATATRHPPIAPGSIAAAPIPGPTAADMQAATGMSPDQQQAMVAGMVDGLERKLAANPRNVAGWVMLMRSRMALGDSTRAAKALKDAVAANPGEASRLKAEAGVLGVPGA